MFHIVNEALIVSFKRDQKAQLTVLWKGKQMYEMWGKTSHCDPIEAIAFNDNDGNTINIQ
jgi:hypothetical protein